MQRVIAFILFAFILSFGILGVNTAFEHSGDDNAITNETFQNPTANTRIILDESNRTGAFYRPNVTVYDENDTEMTQGTDYLWNNESNGTIYVLPGNLAGDANGTITYAWDQTTAEERGMATLIGGILGSVIEPLLFLGGLVFVLVVVTRIR